MNRDKIQGAVYLGESKCRFTLWAPLVQDASVHIVAPEDRIIPLKRDECGYHRVDADNIVPGSLYYYLLEGEQERPDPASRCQPEGVHGRSQIIDTSFNWHDEGWKGIPLKRYVIYELHVGTYTTAGTFNAVIAHLDELAELGITALELMPVAQFPGGRNWGYDGVFPYTVQSSYGGPDGLKQLVDACHQKGMAVILDVVYNHLGPEGNYLADFAPYFTDRYHTPWGTAINYDGAESDEVRAFFLENACYWVRDFHIDALRLDAIHSILDITPYTFIEELTARVHDMVVKLKRRIYLIAESTLNDSRLLRPPASGGFGLDAQWNDDFHHALHSLLTGENTGYYCDYGKMAQLVKAMQEGFVYSGEYSPYRRRRHGISSKDIPAERFVVFSQNHDQVGNRYRSDRLSMILSFEALKLTAGIALLSPFVPLLFMGEEYGAVAPFTYFVSHSDSDLINAVRRGRQQEFAAFQWTGEIPDPQDENTFMQAKLNHKLKNTGQHLILRKYYRELLRLRRELPALSNLSKDNLQVWSCSESMVLCMKRQHESNEIFIAANFAKTAAVTSQPIGNGKWRKLLDSAKERWQGKGSNLPEMLKCEGDVRLDLPPESFCLFVKDGEN